MRRRLLWILLAVWGCGRSETFPHPTKPFPDAGPHDSGMPLTDGGKPDAGKPDAGMNDAGTSCVAPTGPDCAFSEPPMSLTCIPGLKVLSTNTDSQGRFLYQLSFRQPLDHDNPNGPSFEQRMSLHHDSKSSPMVLLATGYELYETYDELDDLFFVNELSVEHRYFGDSATDAGDNYRFLNIRQAALDLHRIRVAFAGLYPKAWVSTGASKGGMTMVYHRRFFPCDVVGTVPFVAPHSGREADPRYNTFLSQVGGTARADCRARLENLQRQLLQRRDAITPTLPHPDSGYTIWGGVDVAFEVSVISFGFGFWQYISPDDPSFGCNSLPTGTLSDAELTSWAQQLIGGDESAAPYAAYYFQAATQLGDPGSYTDPFPGLIRYPGKDSARASIDSSIPVPAFDPQPMQDIQAWLATEGADFVFVYGELDPWSAGQFDLGQATDAFKGIAPGKNHLAELKDLASADKTAALTRLERWLGQKSHGAGNLKATARPRPPPHQGPPVPWRH